MKISIKAKIYWSFFILVSLFIVNGVITIINLQDTKQLSAQISEVADPSMQALGDFNKMMIESKMYSTNWVFLRSNQEDKNSLLKIHTTEYGKLRNRLMLLSTRWINQSWRDSLQNVFINFEKILAVEKKITGSLKKFADYDDPVIKLQAEQVLEDEVIPQTALSMQELERIRSLQHEEKIQEETNLQTSSGRLRVFIIILAVTIISIGIFFSLYMTRIIIAPINRIRHLVNDLGEGVLRRSEHPAVTDEMGKMVLSVNQLSEKLQATAAFAHEIGKRNFNMAFQPLGEEDTLGKALIAMRDDLQSSDERLNEAQHIAKLGSWEWDIGNSVIWSDELYNIFEVNSFSFMPTYEKFLGFVLAEDRERVNNIIMNCLIDHEPFSYECRIITGKFSSKIIFAQGRLIINEQGEPVKMYGTAQDITSRKKAEAKLEINNKELQRKNKELEQFAYVASHDLQEPLRTTASFVQLLQKQYYGKLDSNADKYLDYIVHASDRMKVLITDLLDYSRIGKENEFEKSDCNKILKDVLEDIALVLQETGTEINSCNLPAFTCYPKEVKLLFQNLITNAIKFRKPGIKPQLNISVIKEKGYWHFLFSDNGIGIDEQYKDRIFIIFQRLHTRSEYQGSGIGLSHCRKIVELHNGKIWVQSMPGKGSTFHFTIQENNSIINQKIPHETKIELHNADR